MSEDQLIKRLQQGDNATLKKIYVDYRPDFLAFARKFSVSEDDMIDSYQDAIIALQEQALQGKLANIKSSLKTYLFGIGKYMMYEKARKNSKTLVGFTHKEEQHNYDEIATDFLTETNNAQQQKLQVAFTKLGKKCREVLTLFYYRGYTIDEIAETLQYDNKNVVKSQKSRCLKQLKEIANQEE